MYKKNTFKKNHYIISSYYKMSQETQIGSLGVGVIAMKTQNSLIVF